MSGAGSSRVSVVIPTRGRSELLLRAVDSVRRQTVGEIEIIVVLDGPDAAVEHALAALGEPRLRVIIHPACGLAGRLRNAGADAAASPYVAFLDDDDEWHPDKLRRQLAAAADPEEVLVACRADVQTPTGRYVWPRRPPRPGEPLGEYLFLRRTLFKGEGFIQTSGLMASRSLLARVPFDDGLASFQDWDWVLAVEADGQARFVMLFEPLYLHRTEEKRESVSRRLDRDAALGWVRRRRAWLSPRAYAGFCLVMISADPAAHQEWAAIPQLLSEAFRGGQPTLLNLALFAGMWLVPQDLRRRLRRVLGRRATGLA